MGNRTRDNRPIVYIIGPYRSDSLAGTVNNILEARRRALWAWENDMIPICPHMNSALIDGLVPDSSILSAYRKVMLRCDEVLLIEGWERSEGSQDEFDLATLNGMKVLKDPLRKDSSQLV